MQRPYARKPPPRMEPPPAAPANMESFIPAIDESEKHACYVLYMAGFVAEEIVSEVGVNVNTLKAWITKDGWFRKREEINVARKKKNPPEEHPLAKMLAPDRAEKNIKRFKEVAGEIAVEDIEHWRDLNPQERLVVATAIGTLNKVHRSNLDLDKEEPGGKSAINISFLNNPGAVTVIEESPVKMIENDKDEQA